jgi:hypothetical protein
VRFVVLVAAASGSVVQPWLDGGEEANTVTTSDNNRISSTSLGSGNPDGELR